MFRGAHPSILAFYGPVSRLIRPIRELSERLASFLELQARFSIHRRAFSRERSPGPAKTALAACLGQVPGSRKGRVRAYPGLAEPSDAYPYPKLLPDHAPQGLLQGLALPLHMLLERCVDQGLVVAASRRMHLVLETLEDVVVDADGGPRLPRGKGDWPRFALLKSYCFFIVVVERSPGGATASSQGRKPLVIKQRIDQPCRGGGPNGDQPSR
jgi:hypothetical protein